MRQKRAKAYKRLMSLYSQTFGFRPPFQVLVGQDFLLDLSNKQLDVAKQLSNCVQGECKPNALYKLGREHQATTDLAKTFERRRCNHREAVPEEQCIKDTVGPTNKHRYTLAVQSKRLRTHMRAIAGVPIIHFNDRGVMVLELPSEPTLKHKAALEEGRLTEQLVTHADLPNVVTEAGPSTIPRKKGPKAPNPLSMKKKKSEKPAQPKAGEKPHEISGSNSQPVGNGKRRREAGEDHEEAEGEKKVEQVKKRKVEQEKGGEKVAVAVAVAAEGGEGTGEGQEGKKRKRKRKRKGGAAEATEAGAASGDEFD